MVARLVLVSRWVAPCALLCACSLTSSLDDLEGSAGGDAGGAAGTSGGSAGSGAGTGGVGVGGNAGGGTGGSAGMGGSAGVGGSAGAGGSGATTGTDPPWWDGSWPKRVRLDIANPSSAPLASGFEVGFGLDPALFGAGISTFAVALYSGSTSSWSARPFYVEAAGSKIWIWTPLIESLGAGAVDSSLWLYAGKSGASSGSPAQVFLYWDGFDTATGNWFSQGAPDISGGKLVLPAFSSIRSKTQYPDARAVDYAMTVLQPIVGMDRWICGGFQRSVDFDNTPPWLLWISRATNTVQPEASISGVGQAGGFLALTLAETRLYGVERFATHAVYLRDNSISDQLTWATPDTSNLQIRFNVQSDTAQASFDFVRVRHASDPPPSVTLSAVESAP